MKRIKRYACAILAVLVLMIFVSGCTDKTPISSEYIPENTVVISGKYRDTSDANTLNGEFKEIDFCAPNLIDKTCFAPDFRYRETWPGTDITIDKNTFVFEFDGFKDELSYRSMAYLNGKAVMFCGSPGLWILISRDMKTLKFNLDGFRKMHLLNLTEDTRTEAIRYAKMYIDDLDDYVFTEKYVNMGGENYVSDDSLIEYRFTKYIGDVETMEYVSVSFNAWTNEPHHLIVSCMGDFDNEHFKLSEYKDYLDAQIEGTLKERCEDCNQEYRGHLEPYNIRLGKDEFGRKYIRCNVFLLYHGKNVISNSYDESKYQFDTELDLVIYLPE